MREYELTYLVSDDVLEKDLKTITDRVAGIVSDDGGKVTKEEPWGRRKLTYPIQKQTFATYVTLWLELPKEKIADIEHELRVHPQIIRHLIVVKIAKNDPSREGEAEAQSLAVTKEDIVGVEDVEKIIGEKSFEVVEGETEGSRDLMAKRLTTQTEDTQINTDEKEIEKITETKPEKEAEEAKETKPKKKAIKIIEKKEVVEEPVVEEIVEEKSVEKKAEVKERKIEEKAPDVPAPTSDQSAEADRIKKLDEKLDELLKDDL